MRVSVMSSEEMGTGLCVCVHTQQGVKCVMKTTAEHQAKYIPILSQTGPSQGTHSLHLIWQENSRTKPGVDTDPLTSSHII